MQLIDLRVLCLRLKRVFGDSECNLNGKRITWVSRLELGPLQHSCEELHLTSTTIQEFGATDICVDLHERLT